MGARSSENSDQYNNNNNNKVRVEEIPDKGL